MIYYLIVIVVIKQLLRNKIWSHSYLYLIILVFISFIIIANRLGLDITSSSEYIFKQIEAYHVIQLPILSDYNTFPVSFSPYLGIETPISYIFGFTPSETKLAAHLNSIEAFTYRSDGPFNAYGTSLAYFFPLFGVTIGTGMYLTMFTMIYLCIFFNLNRSRGELLVLFGFLSYFSAFSPLAFSFAFYIYLLLFLLSFAVIRSCKNKDNKSLKVKL
ncbi:hypothetical protein BCT61_17165 [Vibrio breoganii]|nr:hypothetical protein BCT61_17165 [Vibrio breoganii]